MFVYFKFLVGEKDGKKIFFSKLSIGFVCGPCGDDSIVILIDPFYHYHRPLKNISYVSGADIYVNDGKLKAF